MALYTTLAVLALGVGVHVELTDHKRLSRLVRFEGVGFVVYSLNAERRIDAVLITSDFKRRYDGLGGPVKQIDLVWGACNYLRGLHQPISRATAVRVLWEETGVRVNPAHTHYYGDTADDTSFTGEPTDVFAVEAPKELGLTPIRELKRLGLSE